jgi:uncharacterized protein with NRDE domain
MCLIAIAYRASTRYPLLVAANRDENHARPTAAAAWWHDHPEVLGGRDLEAGGTWLALDRRGRFAAVTNLRDAPRGRTPRNAPDREPPAGGHRPEPGSARPSRGLLVTRYLAGADGASEYSAAVDSDAERYAPFNLLLCDRSDLLYTSNRAASRRLAPGIHAFSNTRAGDPWPKITRAREGLERVLENTPTTEGLLALLAERAASSDPAPRRTGLFQLDPDWGTRSSTVVLIRADGRARFTERRFDAEGRAAGEDSFEFALDDPW